MRDGEYLHPVLLNEIQQSHPHINCVHDTIMFPLGV